MEIDEVTSANKAFPIRRRHVRVFLSLPYDQQREAIGMTQIEIAGSMYRRKGGGRGRETANREREACRETRIIERCGNPSESSAALLLICTPRPANRGRLNKHWLNWQVRRRRRRSVKRAQSRADRFGPIRRKKVYPVSNQDCGL